MTSRSHNRYPEGSRTTLVGHRMLPTLLSIVILAGSDVTAAEAAFNDVNSGGSSNNELWYSNGGGDPCLQNREVAEACSACSKELLPRLIGVTSWQCCHDSETRKQCVAAVASLLATPQSSDDEDTVVDNAVSSEKRAKYFLGKRAKYFLGKRVFGERAGMRFYHRPGQRLAATAEDFSMFGDDQTQSQNTADKRAKYFLG